MCICATAIASNQSVKMNKLKTVCLATNVFRLNMRRTDDSSAYCEFTFVDFVQFRFPFSAADPAPTQQIARYIVICIVDLPDLDYINHCRGDVDFIRNYDESDCKLIRSW